MHIGTAREAGISICGMGRAAKNVTTTRSMHAPESERENIKRHFIIFITLKLTLGVAHARLRALNSQILTTTLFMSDGWLEPGAATWRAESVVVVAAPSMASPTVSTSFVVVVVIFISNSRELRWATLRARRVLASMSSVAWRRSLHSAAAGDGVYYSSLSVKPCTLHNKSRNLTIPRDRSLSKSHS